MKIATGNFNSQVNDYRGWVVGHFLGADSPLKTNDLEVKWGFHKRGESKNVKASNTRAKSIAILIRGKVRLRFDDKDIVLAKEGDYCFYDSGVSHSWVVEEDCLAITIRWPSLAGDQKSG